MGKYMAAVQWQFCGHVGVPARNTHPPSDLAPLYGVTFLLCFCSLLLFLCGSFCDDVEWFRLFRSSSIQRRGVHLVTNHVRGHFVPPPPFSPGAPRTRERSLSESGHGESLCKKDMSSCELELISSIANPKGGNRALSIRIRAR